MTMLDDDRLAALFGRAGASFDVPASGPDDILARAAGRPPLDARREEHAGDAFDDTVFDDAAFDDTVFDELTPGPGRLGRITGVARRHRMLSVAACIVVVLVLAGVVGTLVRSPARPSLTTAQAKEPARVPTHTPLTTTTLPNLQSNGAAGQSQLGRPFGTSGTSGTSAGAATDAPSATPTSTPALPYGAVGQSAKIEQTGSLGLTVGRGKLDRTVTQLTGLASAFGGFVANSQTQSGAAAASGATPSGSVTLQVPVNNFAAVLKRAQALGKTSDLTTKATDVTGQYVDLQSRISALQDTRQQYLTILAKATTVGDVLAVQEQVNSIQSQIEQLQGQLQLLTSQTSYSTLTVTVSEGAPLPRPNPVPESGVVRAWHTSVGGFVSGVEGVIRIAGPLLFALLLAGVVLLGGRAVWRRYQRHNL